MLSAAPISSAAYLCSKKPGGLWSCTCSTAEESEAEMLWVW